MPNRIPMPKQLSPMEIGRRCSAMAPPGERDPGPLAVMEVARRLDAYDRTHPNESRYRDRE